MSFILGEFMLRFKSIDLKYLRNYNVEYFNLWYLFKNSKS
ncbi:MAG: hypothetical protein BAJALOKI3v1_70030 [Promethearchaeota archaeon]|nr:MAG: hypothetical protein BAJALOKI3v1_70030 [Candidatus Lokiarchaeota archaeon]